MSVLSGDILLLFLPAGDPGSPTISSHETCTGETSRNSMQIRQVQKPTLLLWGANDEVLDPKMLSKYEADIKQTETRVFDDCGHWVHLEQADGMVEEIRNFSERKSSAGVSS